MNWKEFFRPTKRKIIFSIAVTFILYLTRLIIYLNNSGQCKCTVIGTPPVCTDYHFFLLIKEWTCHCGCTSISKVISQYFWIIVIPFVLFYIIYSAIRIIILKYKNP
jgi:hypothetical protein